MDRGLRGLQLFNRRGLAFYAVPREGGSPVPDTITELASHHVGPAEDATPRTLHHSRRRFSFSTPAASEPDLLHRSCTSLTSYCTLPGIIDSESREMS